MDVLLRTYEVRVMAFSLLSVIGLFCLVATIKMAQGWGKALKVALHVCSPSSNSAYLYGPRIYEAVSLTYAQTDCSATE
jgi:hypothetical protein